jgi:hypothetical protein
MDRLRELGEIEVVKVCDGGRGDRLILESIEAGVGDEMRRLSFGKSANQFEAADMNKCNYCNRDRMTV